MTDAAAQRAGPRRALRSAFHIDRRTHRIALAGLGAVIVALTAFGLWSNERATDASQAATAATRLSDVYERARFAVGEEESLERKYRLEPGPAALASYRAAVAGLAAALDEIRRSGPEHRQMATQLLRDHTRYLGAIEEMFSAVDAGNTRRVRAIDARRVDPLFGAIESRIDHAARAQHGAALTSLGELRSTQSFVLTGTAIAFGVGLVLIGLFGLLLARVHRAVEAHAGEREHAALHDPLTGLPNRALFADRLDHAVRAASRDPAPFSVLMLDLDRFKEINDTLGHATGDLLLQAVGPRLESALRPGDTVARLGGDEFALLLPSAGSEDARAVATRALAALREPFALPSITVSIDASVGIVTSPTHGRDAETLMQRVDVAMYLAKGQGGGDMLYDAARDPYDPERLAFAGDLRRAIDDDELELHYQPKFDTHTLEVTTVEALVRWLHPDRGLLGPDQFIPLAEHTGAIRALTLLVLRKAVRQVAAWRASGLDLCVAVNLSVANLLDDGLVDDVADILEREDVPARYLELEITESTLMTDPERATTLLEELAAMGVQLSIDDFGTGYSSLAYLRRLPIKEIKIDRAFVRHLAVDESDATIVRSTIELSHSLDLAVVAEGVEDARSLERLRDFGCDRAQGFHLARPAPAETIDGVLRRHATAPGAA
jgi:diguanylate cyclase (GGDEF)-like protein